MEAQVRTVEEHSGVSHAVRSERSVGDCFFADFRVENSMYVIVMARDTLAFAAQDAAVLEPVPYAVQDNDFVPEGSLCCDRPHMLGRSASRGTSSEM